MKNIFEQDHFSLSDEEFAQQFQLLNLNPSWFTHVAHIRLAWIQIQKQNSGEAAATLCHQITAFDKKFGSGNRFNNTVTTAFTKMIWLHQNRKPAKTFRIFIDENPEFMDSYRHLLSQHYSYNIFESESARMEYAEPDLKPFPAY